MINVLVGLGLLFAGYKGGEHIAKRDAGSSSSSKPPAKAKSELEPPATPPRFTAAQAAELVEADGAGVRRFRRRARVALGTRFETSSLVQVGAPPGLLFYRVVPLAQTPAAAVIERLRGQRAIVFASLSCMLPSGERLVAFAPAESAATLDDSYHFARFEPPAEARPDPKAQNGAAARPPSPDAKPPGEAPEKGA